MSPQLFFLLLEVQRLKKSTYSLCGECKKTIKVLNFNQSHKQNLTLAYLQNTFNFIAVSRTPFRTSSFVALHDNALPWSSLVGVIINSDILTLPSSETFSLNEAHDGNKITRTSYCKNSVDSIMGSVWPDIFWSRQLCTVGYNNDLSRRFQNKPVMKTVISLNGLRVILHSKLRFHLRIE
uniref:Uncharacterized protein n=1 Tax=Glossina austeni TaxID=7395 RepID=A0A1A9USK8_GLOAU